MRVCLNMWDTANTPFFGHELRGKMTIKPTLDPVGFPRCVGDILLYLIIPPIPNISSIYIYILYLLVMLRILHLLLCHGLSMFIICFLTEMPISGYPSSPSSRHRHTLHTLLVVCGCRSHDIPASTIDQLITTVFFAHVGDIDHYCFFAHVGDAWDE